MPWLITVSHTARLNDLIALYAASGKLFFIALSAIDVIFAGDERSCSDGVFANAATETFLVPLMSLVFHLFRTCTEHFGTSVATGCECGVVTSCTVNFLSLRSERLVYQRHATLGTQETLLVPMLLFVGKILGIDSDGLGTFVAGVGKHLFITADAIRMFIAQNVTLACQRIVTLPTTEVSRVPILIHGFGIFAAEDQFAL